MEIRGYKAFHHGLLNKYGMEFELGKIYCKDASTLKFGESGHGYHLAESLADTFRFFNPIHENDYCEVVASGKILRVDNHLYHSAPMYVAEKLQIVKILSREDILQLVGCADMDEIRRYLALFPFQKMELEWLKGVILARCENDEVSWMELFEGVKSYQPEEVASFKRDLKYLRKLI